MHLMNGRIKMAAADVSRAERLREFVLNMTPFGHVSILVGLRRRPFKSSVWVSIGVLWRSIGVRGAVLSFGKDMARTPPLSYA